MKRAIAVMMGVLAALSAAPRAGQNAPAVAIDNDDIGGVVTSSAGPEAGVWVIAETGDFRPASRRSSSPTIAADI